MPYTPRPGYIRLKFLEKLYFKFQRSSYDSKLIWMPWLVGYTLIILSLATTAFIYQVAMLWSQNDLNRDIKARLPFEFKNEQMTEVYRLLKESKNEESEKEGKAVGIWGVK